MDCRQYANNCVWLSVQDEGLSENIRVPAEARLPEPVRNYGRGALSVLDRAAQSNGHSCYLKIISGHARDEQALGSLARAPIDLLHLIRADESIKHVRIANEFVLAHGGAISTTNVSTYQRVWIADCGLAKKKLRGEAENRRVHSDSEREGKHGCRC